MIDIANPTLTEALYLGLGFGGLFGLTIGFIVGFLAYHWMIPPAR